MKNLRVCIPALVGVFLFTSVAYAVGIPRSHSLKEGNGTIRHDINSFIGDSRKDLKDNKAPWSAIGRLKLPTGSACSATLIARDLILTAAHCIWDNENNRFRTGDYQFQAGYRNGNWLAASGVSYAWWGSREGNLRENDWAIMRLRAPIGDQVGWMGCRNFDVDDLLNNTETLYHASYATDWRSMEVPYWQRDCTFRDRATPQALALHDCSTSRGSSGGAMFIWDSRRNAHYIVALNVGEYRGGGERSFIGIPYSADRANVAIPSTRFFQTLKNILATGNM